MIAAEPVDPYQWLESSTSPAVITWVDSQNERVEKYFSGLSENKRISDRLEVLSAEEGGLSVKIRSGSVFYLRKEKNQKQIIVGKRVLISTDESQGVLGQWFPSPDGKWIAYAIHPDNETRGLLHVKAVEGNSKEQIMPWADFADLAWRPNSSGFYYSRIPSDASLSSSELVRQMDIAYHLAGSNPTQDPQVYPSKNDAAIYLTPSLSADGRWLFVSEINGWTSTNIFMRDEHLSEGIFEPVFISTADRATPAGLNGRIFLLTNQNASHYQVLTASPTLRPLQWSVFVPENPDRVLQGIHATGTALFLVASHNLSSALLTVDDHAFLKEIEMPSLGSLWEPDTGPNALCFGFESFFEAARPYCTDPSNKLVIPYGKKMAPAIDKRRQRVDFVRFPSKDGAQVSMFVLRPSERPAKFMLNVYGGFNVSLTPYYSPETQLLLENGWGVAIPHARGGGEYGENWHRQGMLNQKQHTFDDSIAAAEYLIKQGWTTPAMLAIRGGSNGGLTAGALVTQRPDLFRAAVIKVPILDMVRFPLFGEGSTWIPEFGDPSKKQDREILLSYSPYHRVRKGTMYPAIFFISSDNDERVDPMHARKMAAALQTATSSGRPILLFTKRNAGHSGNNPVKTIMPDQLMTFSFLENEVRTDRP